MLCKYNGRGCSKEDNCAVSEEARQKACAISLYFEWLDQVVPDKNISQVIRELVREYCDPDGNDFSVKTAYDINCGLCEDFAGDVIRRMGGYTDSLFEMDFMNLAGSDEDPSSDEFDEGWLRKNGYELPDGVSAEALNQMGPAHIFVYCDGRYYDAECPEGVDTPFALPLILNNLKLSQRVPCPGCGLPVPMPADWAGPADEACCNSCHQAAEIGAV